jgi:hypothetical protein
LSVTFRDDARRLASASADNTVNAEVLGLSASGLPRRVSCISPKAPRAVISWMFSVTPGSAIKRARVACSPNPAKAMVAATLAFLGYWRATSAALPSMSTVASRKWSSATTDSAALPRQPCGGLRPV